MLHWSETTAEERRNGVTSPLRTVVDCARLLPFGEGLAVADAALAKRLLGPEELLAATSALRGPGCPSARRVASCADGRAGSFLESMVRSLFITAGVEGFEPQVLVTSGPFRARVDLVTAGWLVLRFTYQQVMGDPEWVIATVRAPPFTSPTRPPGARFNANDCTWGCEEVAWRA